jgi:hypothetical protein
MDFSSWFNFVIILTYQYNFDLLALTKIGFGSNLSTMTNIVILFGKQY